MKKNEMIEKMVSYYKKTLNKKSKWFETDIEDYRANLLKLSMEALREKYLRLQQIEDENSNFNKDIKKYISKLNKAGMYNIENMKPCNVLD
jgi:hypothetical protein